MQAGMESCLTKSIMAGGMGFALGGAFGLFMSSVSLCPSIPVSHDASNIKSPSENQPFIYRVSTIANV